MNNAIKIILFDFQVLWKDQWLSKFMSQFMYLKPRIFLLLEWF